MNWLSARLGNLGMERKVILKHIEQQVEELLYLKNEILSRATNGVDYSLHEATRLIGEQLLAYAERVDRIEDEILTSLPELYSVQVDVSRTLVALMLLKRLRVVEIGEDDGGDGETTKVTFVMPKGLDAVLETLQYYNRCHYNLHRIADEYRRNVPDRLTPEEMEALKTQECNPNEERRNLLAPSPTYGFPDIYRVMQQLRFMVENVVPEDVWLQRYDCDYKYVLSILQNDLDTSLRQAEPELADVIAKTRRERDANKTNLSSSWVKEMMRKIRKITSTSRRKEDRGCVFEIVVDDPRSFLNTYFEEGIFLFGMMGGFDSIAARGMRQSWMKILIENSTIGAEWDPEKIREVRDQFLREEYEARLGKDVAASFIGMFEDAIAIAKQDDFLNPAGSRSWFSTWNTE